MELEKIYLYRITHFRNLEHILRNGLLCPNHQNADRNYYGIGDKSLIQVRDKIVVPIPPGGKMHDYVAFYFGPHSPMLFQIMTGYEGIPKLPQGEIVYLVCQLKTIVDAGLGFVFTNGHARNSLSVHYNSLTDLNKVDWEIVKERYWRNTLEDPDLQRRKQAEFLVHSHVPTECISAILVYDQERAKFAEETIAALGLQIPVHKEKAQKWYY
jgi:ssDNA thymidine ADP-ribosyltransferase, DarT